MPLEAVGRIVFTKEDVTAEDVIAVLEPEYDYYKEGAVQTQEKVIKIVHRGDGSKGAEGILPDLLRDRAKSDVEFPRKFVVSPQPTAWLTYPSCSPSTHVLSSPQSCSTLRLVITMSHAVRHMRSSKLESSSTTSSLDIAIACLLHTHVIMF
jgi:hypothetical protein